MNEHKVKTVKSSGNVRTGYDTSEPSLLMTLTGSTTKGSEQYSPNMHTIILSTTLACVRVSYELSCKHNVYLGQVSRSAFDEHVLGVESDTGVMA